jgi:hypothetical protein
MDFNDLRHQIALIQEPMKRLEHTLGKLHNELMVE